MRKINFKKIGLAVALLMSAFTFQSCDTDDDTNWDQVLPNALVTVKQNADACYLQLDDNTTLLAKNLKTPVFDGKEVRALILCFLKIRCTSLRQIELRSRKLRRKRSYRSKQNIFLYILNVDYLNLFICHQLSICLCRCTVEKQLKSVVS